MKKFVTKSIILSLVCAVLALSGALACAAAQNEYTVTQINDMTLTLPDGMSAITRDSKSTDKYFSVFGLDYDTTMKTFENSDIYLQGTDSMSSIILTVTMTENEDSKNVDNYSVLSQSELTDITTNYLNDESYSGCTVDQAEKITWLIFNSSAQDSDGAVGTFTANTVFAGKNIIVTMKRTEGSVTAVDYDTFYQIVSSVTFSDLPFSSGIIPYVIIGGGLIILALLILIIILAVRIKKHKKARKNNAILEELASKYKLGDKEKDGGYDISAFDDEPSGKPSALRYSREPEEAPEESDAAQYYRYAPEPEGNYAEDESSEYSGLTTESRYSDEREIDEIINSAKAYKNRLEQEAHKDNYGYAPASTEIEKKKELTEQETAKTDKTKQNESIPQIEPSAEEETDGGEFEYEDISSSSANSQSKPQNGPTLVIPEPEYDLFETGEPDDIDREDDSDAEEAEKISGNDSDSEPGVPALERRVNRYADIVFGSDDSHDEDSELDDEELVRRSNEKNKFDSGYDFFEEAPKKSMGFISSYDLKDAEDVDVIEDVEKKAKTVKKNAFVPSHPDDEQFESPREQTAAETLAKIGSGFKAFGRGAKSFFVHCGYFCTNISHMIKHKRAAAKRKKAEEARRERERQRAERARRRAQAGNDGLVQVHRQTRSPQSRPANRNIKR